MILTCHDCPRQISFPGSKRDEFARLFGWMGSSGLGWKRYHCASCAAEQNVNSMVCEQMPAPIEGRAA